jgi:hypothetical protein
MLGGLIDKKKLGAAVLLKIGGKGKDDEGIDPQVALMEDFIVAIKDEDAEAACEALQLLIKELSEEE